MSQSSPSPNIFQAPPHVPRVFPPAIDRPEWSFFWKSGLSNVEKNEICDWLKTLTPEQNGFITALIKDRISQEAFNNG